MTTPTKKKTTGKRASRVGVAPGGGPVAEASDNLVLEQGRDAPEFKGTRISGSALLPAFDRHVGGQIQELTYWVGVIPTCPVEGLVLGGIQFPKLNENLIRSPLRAGGTQRVPVIGALVFMTEETILRIAERLPRTVIRFLDEPGKKEEPGTGMNLGDVHERPRRGHVITIPSDEVIEARKKARRATNRYVSRPGDRPAAEFMFAMLCPDQDRPTQGDYYPDTLSVTGLEWPFKIDEE